MPANLSETTFINLFLDNTPILDVRAPIEFSHGSLPNSTNLPLLTDTEREAVGTKFKSSGQIAAITLAEQLLGPTEKVKRLSAWSAYIKTNPQAVLLCFRGGLRSHTVQEWLTKQGYAIPLVEGGLKAVRRFLMDSLEKSASMSDFVIVAGNTGTGKTHLINHLRYSIDLEGIAGHRGSAFGKRLQPQPSQIYFENNLSGQFLKLPVNEANRIFLEDESRGIGSLSIPLCLHNKMSDSPIAIVDEPLESRVNTILNDYIISNYREFESEFDTKSMTHFSEFLFSGLSKIKRRLGGEGYVEIDQLMNTALSEQKTSNNIDLHKNWIRKLLSDYYDPMYEYQLSKKLQRVVFRGKKNEFLDWASHIDHKKN